MKDKIHIITKYFNLVLGILLTSISFNLFLSPNNLAAGGISGMALVYHDLYKIDISTFILVANIILIFISLKCLGKAQTSRTIIGSILFPIFVSLTVEITNKIDLSEMELIVKAIFGGIISGFGYGLIFKGGFTSGGTDIIDQLVSKYYKVSMSTAIILVDGFIVLMGGVVFGVEKMIYAAITLILISHYSNKSMIEMNYYKTFYITTTKIKEVCNFLIDKYQYNVTLFDTKGGYTKSKRKMIMCVMRSHDYYEVNQALKIIDPNSFVTIFNSYEAINHGKRE